MRIGYDAKRAFNNTSGLGNYSRFVISSMIGLFPENSYRLFTPRQNHHFRNFFPKNAGVAVIEPRGLNARLPGFWRVFNQLSDLKRQEVELFHGLSNELPIGLQKAGIKSVVTIHDLIFLRFPELYKPIDRLIYKRKFATACKQADCIIAISEQTKSDIVQYFGTESNKIEVIYQDCDPAFQQPLAPEFLAEVKRKFALPEKYLLCVGTLEKRKNQLHLLKAWHQSGTALELVFVGRTTPYAQELHAYIAQHQLSEKVHFLPYVPFQELPAIYRAATLFAYPSVFEGFGIPILEALNCEVPVITSTGSCFAEAGGNAAFYVAPNDLNGLQAAIARIGADESLQAEMKKKGLVHAHKFRPENTIIQLHELYRRVLEGNSTNRPFNR
ncbi:glycosyltransferase family 4 protein [Adhaeribacter soli]|uniref:Glycosyltransferase family 4 protein n=2 Tax=Adhaeribacter soli TaxID=2607655 RepID=A0A5N1IZA6_9BACT|nr:glycosyltransferase family 4 protein [Adhaeribacter soli]